jgi:spore coat polysaccharide biosynthesis predicted glycosyltransferase SpsG
MRFIFRADASKEIGSGHVMRSSVLAEEAISRGLECIFVGSILDLGWASERIAKLGFSQVLTNHDSFEPDSESDVLILDTYSLSLSDPFIAKKKWKLVLSICDEITPKYDSHIELRPGLVEVRSDRNVPKVLSGADYVLIRKGIGKSKRERSLRDFIKVLVVGGGSDPFGFVGAISEVLCSMNFKMDVHLFTNGVDIKDSKVRFVKHPIGSNLDLIANDVDVVFTTASTSSFEFIAREIPTGIACAVDNQIDNYAQLGSLGYAAQVGRYGSNGKWDFSLPSIRELLKNQEKQDSLRFSTRSLIDLKGAERVVNVLVSLAE